MAHKIKTGILIILLAVLAILKWFDFNAEFDIGLLIFWLVFSGMLLLDNEKKKKKDKRLFYLVPFIGFIYFLIDRLVDYFM
jgi:chromate transport protein ChrA